MADLTDTHTHLFTSEFDPDREEVLARAKEAGVGHLFIPNIDDISVEAMLTLCDTHAHCHPLIGLHPTSVDERWAERLAYIERVLRSGRRFAGIGEAGIDLYWDTSYKAEQLKVFDIQVQWALEYGLPLIVHCRSAYPELLDALSPYRECPLTGIFHSFTGTEEEAGHLLAFRGFMLGINGVVTFKKNTLSEVLKAAVPVGRVVLETDSPYLAPVPYRGKRNESAYVVKVAEKLSDIYGKSLEEIACITSSNALKVFSCLQEGISDY